MERFAFDFYLLKNFIIGLSYYFNAAYVFVKAVNFKPNKKSFLLLSASAVVLSFLRAVFNSFSFTYSQIIFIMLFALSVMLVCNNNRKNALPISLISFGIAFCVDILSMLITGSLMYFLKYVLHFLEFDNNFIFDNIMNAFITFGLCFLLMKIKRFKNGFAFLQEEDNFGIGIIISGLVLIIACADSDNAFFTQDTLIYVLIGLLVSLIGLFIWIRKSITNQYRERLQAKAEEHYSKELSKKDEYIDKLMQSNEFLSKIVHRDNHLMGALEHTITEFLSTKDDGQREKLLNEILTLSRERGELIRKEQINAKVLPTTGIAVIDGALGGMYVKTAAHGIDFDLIVSDEIHYIVNNFITQTELETLLCDHIKDAVIAVEASGGNGGKILVSIAKTDEFFEISIKDSGVEFTPETLNKLGRERFTTHAGQGGSGIGFVTTFETLKKAGASLVITEYKEKQPFTKSVAFRFDGENRFVIHSYRGKELADSITRTDVVIV